MEAAASGAFDVVHSHLHVHALVHARMIPNSLVSAVHGSARGRATRPILLEYKTAPFVSISDAERTMSPELNYLATVYTTVRLDDFPIESDKDEYPLYPGRIASQKGTDEAVQIARTSGRRHMMIAGLIEGQD